MASATLTHRDYTVGWICALPEEQTAALAMLDDRHADLPKPQHDDNAYTLGRIGKHNIVIACLPMGLIGNNKSATVAAHMVSTFPLIKFGLMVGIGGGVPPQVRLGDVVVSKPVGEFGGVVQWDFGKAGQGNTFKRVGALNNPPAALLTAITKLQSKYDMDGSEIPNHLEDLKQKWPKLAPQYLKTDRLKDILFKSSYRHIEKNVSGDDDWEYEEEEQESCPYCDHAQVVKRNPAAREMRVHYGLIASGNQVVKDAVRRNEINKMLGGNVLCFEMEAAGLMNDFPCIVVRGICDYADSHKNKNWQKHAAAVAAAFAKEFLHMVPAHEVEEMPTIQNVYETVKDIAGDVNILTQRHHHEEQHAILDWLTAVDYSSQQNDFIRKCQPGTGTWLLGSEAFQRWLTEPDQILFCPGIPGAGKTIATSTVIDYLFQRFQDNSTGIAYIYCNFRQQEEQHLMDLLLSLLKQFAQGHPTIPDCVKSLYDKHKSNRTRPSLTEISGALKSIITGLSKAFIIVDALDECKSTDGIRSQLLLEIFNLQANTKANLFATSRSIPEIEEEFKRKGAVLLEIRASDNDIRRYLDGNTSRLPSFVRENPELEDKVKRAIITAADGMFLLATLHLGSLEDKVNLRQIEDALVKLPKGTDAYSQAYQEAMERIQCQKHGFRDLAFKTLSWISRARRPLAPRELQHALAIVENRPALDEANITKVELIASACAGLVIIDEESNIIRLVHYTTQEYFQETWSVWFPNAETDIAKACITYLSFDNFSTGLCLTNHEFDERLRLNPLYSYAARNWGHHARAASVELEQELITFLENENRVSASSQALMATESSLDYVQRRELYMTGVNLAAYFGLEKVTATLYENGHDPDSKDSGGRTPLAWAAMEGHEMIVKQLLDREGVNPDLKDSGDWTPLLLAAMEGHEKIVRLLLDNDKVNPDSKDQQGLTPLAWAAIEGYEAIVKLLLDNDRVDPDSENWEGATPLSWAAIEGHEAVVKLLLDNDKVDPDSKDWKGTTPLSWAAYRGHEAVVKLLLDNLGVDPDSKDKRGRTPLSFAAWMGHENIVKLLLGHDSDPDTKDGSGRTPVSWAAKEGQEKIVKLLKEHRRISIP